MAFIRFKGKGGKASSPFPIVSIWKDGAAGFNINAIKMCDLDKYKFAEVYFDADVNKIGFLFISKKTEHSRSLSKRPSGYTICIRALLNYYKIDYSTPKKYQLELNSKNGLYVIQV